MTRTRSGRLAWLDAARGAALVAMILYHGAWDMSVLGLIPVDIYASRGWTLFARAIASSFLVLVGVSLVAAESRGVLARAYPKRIALIAGAAAVITAATLIATPETPILFGILHCIAASSVLGSACLRLPGPACLALAPVVIALPRLDLAAFDAVWMQWLGLRSGPPSSLDYVPLLPWFGATLIGIGLAKLLPTVIERAGPRVPVLDALGRNSLLVYLVHQPLLLAVLYPLSRVVD